MRGMSLPLVALWLVTRDCAELHRDEKHKKGSYREVCPRRADSFGKGMGLCSTKGLRRHRHHRPLAWVMQELHSHVPHPQPNPLKIKGLLVWQARCSIFSSSSLRISGRRSLSDGREGLRPAEWQRRESPSSKVVVSRVRACRITSQDYRKALIPVGRRNRKQENDTRAVVVSAGPPLHCGFRGPI